jgi:hypothetical protein
MYHTFGVIQNNNDLVLWTSSEDQEVCVFEPMVVLPGPTPSIVKLYSVLLTIVTFACHIVFSINMKPSRLDEG